MTSLDEKRVPIEPCEDHDWEKHPYEYDTNAGGYKECRICGKTESLTTEDMDSYGDYEDNYI